MYEEKKWYQISTIATSPLVKSTQHVHFLMVNSQFECTITFTQLSQ